MTILRMPGGDVRDEVRQPFYDTIRFEATISPVGTHKFFDVVAGKNIAQTNLTQSKMFSGYQSFRILGLGIDAQNFYAGNIKALPLIMEYSAIELNIGEKKYWKGPMLFLAGRLDQESTVADSVYQRFGAASVQPVILKGKHVLDINPVQDFFVEWNCFNMPAAELADATPKADTHLTFICSLKGLFRRPVQ